MMAPLPKWKCSANHSQTGKLTEFGLSTMSVAHWKQSTQTALSKWMKVIPPTFAELKIGSVETGNRSDILDLAEVHSNSKYLISSRLQSSMIRNLRSPQSTSPRAQQTLSFCVHFPEKASRSWKMHLKFFMAILCTWSTQHSCIILAFLNFLTYLSYS